MYPDYTKLGPTSYTWLPRLSPTLAPTSKAAIRPIFCKLLMTNVDYTATISKTLRLCCGSTSNSVRTRTTIFGGPVMAGLPLECLGSFKRFAFPTPAAVLPSNKPISPIGLGRLSRLRGDTRLVLPCRVTSPQFLTVDVHLQTTGGALRNFINDSSTFEDASSTALIASVTFRLAVLNGDNITHIANADAAYNYVGSNIDSSGFLQHTVDPLTFNSLSDSNNPSPEGQSFVLLLESARRDFQDWVQANATLPGGSS